MISTNTTTSTTTRDDKFGLGGTTIYKNDIKTEGDRHNRSKSSVVNVTTANNNNKEDSTGGDTLPIQHHDVDHKRSHSSSLNSDKDTTSSSSSSKTSEASQQQQLLPNIIFILTDQQHSNMMSCAGNKYLKTPAMDYLAKHGKRFTRAYTTNPVCVAARIGLMTGRFPSCVVSKDSGGKNKNKQQQPVRENSGGRNVKYLPPYVKETTIGNVMSKTGYKLIYGGKQHLPSVLEPQKHKFEILSMEERSKLGEKAAKYIRNYNNNNNNNSNNNTITKQQPYFMWLNFINPHDICYLAIHGFPKNPNNLTKDAKKDFSTELRKAMILPTTVGDDGGRNTAENFCNSNNEDDEADYNCPPIPINFEPQIDEPKSIRELLKVKKFRIMARNNATKQDWRYHRYVYHRLTEIVDKQIQLVLDAIHHVDSDEQKQNTMVIFSSDHGDMDASHKMEHKSTLYEESANVPFIVMWKGHIEPGQVDNQHLISNGLDILPTVCDYATNGWGYSGGDDDDSVSRNTTSNYCQSHPLGRSLRPLLEGTIIDADEEESSSSSSSSSPSSWRKTLGVESHIGQMVVSEDGYKYLRYDFPLGVMNVEEQLLDLNLDPYETKHYTNSTLGYHQTKLDDLRNEFYQVWFPNITLP